MNKIVKAVGLIALAAMVVVGMAGCGILSLTVSGDVVNVQAPKDTTVWYKSNDGTMSLDGAEITLTNLSTDDTYHGTVETGTYSIGGVPAGSYIVTGAASGWTFVPRRVELTGFFNTLPNILAYVTPTGVNADQILVMVDWSNLDMDVDSYMARDLSNNNTQDGSIVAGFIDLTLNSYYADSVYDAITLDRDVTQNSPATVPRVETIRISSPATGAFEQLRYYVRLYNQAAGSLTGNPEASVTASASATVFVMQGTTHLGTYQIAIDSAEQVLGVVQMEWLPTGTSTDPTPQWRIGSFGNPIFGSTEDGLGTTGMRAITDGPVVVSEIK